MEDESLSGWPLTSWTGENLIKVSKSDWRLMMRLINVWIYMYLLILVRAANLKNQKSISLLFRKMMFEWELGICFHSPSKYIPVIQQTLYYRDLNLYNSRESPSHNRLNARLQPRIKKSQTEVIHFWTNTRGKSINSLIPLVMGLIVSLQFFYKDGFGIK